VHVAFCMSFFTGSRSAVSWYLKNGRWDSEWIGGGPFCSGLLDDGDYSSATCAFRASIWALMPYCTSLLCFSSSINRCSRRSAASKLSSLCLWYLTYLLAARGVGISISKSTQCNPGTSIRVTGKARNHRAGPPDNIRNSYSLWIL